MITTEREMIRPIQNDDLVVPERTSSLQPTYEDSIPPNEEADWEFENE